MSVTLIRAYGNYNAGQVLSLSAEQEQSLIRQGIAVVANELATIIPTLPMSLTALRGFGKAETSVDSMIDAFIEANPTKYKPSTVYVGTNGTDAATVGGLPNRFYATPEYAMRTSTLGSDIVIVNTMTVTLPPQLRYNDASQVTSFGQMMKILRVASDDITCTIRVSGPDPKTATWVADGVFTNCYGPGTNWVSAGASVTRVMREDQTDEEGYYKQFRQFTTLALLDVATAPGFYYDVATRQPYVNMQASVETNKAILKMMFLDTSGNSRIISIGSTIGIDKGIVLEGVQCLTNDGPALSGRRPQFISHNLDSRWSIGKACDGAGGGDFMATNPRVHSSQQDGFNNSTSSLTGEALIFVVNPGISKTGDMDVFASNGTYQSISSHPGSNTVCWGGYLRGSNGQNIAETTALSGIGHSNESWFVGTIIGPSHPLNAASVNNMAVGGTADSARSVYFDRVYSDKGGTNDLRIDPGASVYINASPSISVISGSAIAGSFYPEYLP